MSMRAWMLAAMVAAADQGQLDRAIAQLDQKEYEAAALSALEVANDAGDPDLKSSAQMVVGKALYRMGLLHSALAQFARLASLGPQGKQFGKALEWLVFISHKTVNTSVMMDEVARHQEAQLPERFRSEVIYLLARHQAAKGRLEDVAGKRSDGDRSFASVKSLAAKLAPTDEFYPEARYLAGVALFRDDRQQDAVEAMKDVIRSTRAGADRSKSRARRDRKLRDLAFMQLGRIHYGKRQFRHADAYFQKVSRGGEQWLESLFEAAWATYRMNQDERALGNLVTLAAPTFRDDYYPEASVLEAVIYYQNCRFSDARARVDAFERTYVPVHEQLVALTKGKASAAEFYQLLTEAQASEGGGKGTDKIMRRILGVALSNKDFEALNESIRELDAEVDMVGRTGESFRYSSVTASLLADLKSQREALIEKAGTIGKAMLEAEEGELSVLIQNALRIRFEITAGEARKLEAKLGPGGKAGDQPITAYDFEKEVGDDQLYWPQREEYWRDELGTYLYTLTEGCGEQRATGALPE
jgi:hypothetical protein